MCLRNSRKLASVAGSHCWGQESGGDKARVVTWEAVAIFQVRDVGFSLGVPCVIFP